MKHEQILERLLEQAKNDTNTLGFLVFGSVASGTHHEESDIDVITVLCKQQPPVGLEHMQIDGIEVGNMFFTDKILTKSINTVPYLPHPLSNAKILFDRENTIQPLLKQIKEYFSENPQIENDWNRYYKQLKEEKIKYGYDKTTIIDFWNVLERQYSEGKIKRPFFNSFYYTNTLVFSFLKRLLYVYSYLKYLVKGE